MLRFGYVFLFLVWGFTLIHFKDLPPEIPIHFNAKGIPDGYGSKNSIWFLPLLSTFLFFGVKRLAKQMSKTNEKHLFHWISVATTNILGYIQIQTFFVALHRSEGLGGWFLPFTLLFILGPTLYFAIRSAR